MNMENTQENPPTWFMVVGTVIVLAVFAWIFNIATSGDTTAADLKSPPLFQPPEKPPAWTIQRVAGNAVDIPIVWIITETASARRWMSVMGSTPIEIGALATQEAEKQ